MFEFEKHWAIPFLLRLLYSKYTMLVKRNAPFLEDPEKSRTAKICCPVALAAGGVRFFPSLWQGRVLLPDRLLGALPWALEQAVGRNMPGTLCNGMPWRNITPGGLFSGRTCWPEAALLESHAFCGTPFLANGQSTVLYPFTWLFSCCCLRHRPLVGVPSST